MNTSITHNNPFSPSPRGLLYNNIELVGQDEFFGKFWKCIQQSMKGKFIPLIIRGEIGGGKSTIFSFVEQLINKKKEIPKNISDHKIICINTKLIHPTISNLVNSFINQLKIILEEDELEIIKNCEKSVNKILSLKNITDNYFTLNVIYL